jgi:hypothetical protein
VLEYCSEEGLGVLANRPLNAFAKNRLIRLSDVAKAGQKTPSSEDLKELLKPLREHEQRISSDFGIPLMSGGSGVAGLIEDLVPRLQSSSVWEQLAGHYVIRPLQSWLREGQDKFATDMRWQAWVERLIQIVNPLFEEIGRFLLAKEQSTSDSVRAELHRAGYPPGEETLSRMAMNVLANLPGLTCILNGMRRREYVNDALGVAQLDPVDGLGILKNFNSQ